MTYWRTADYWRRYRPECRAMRLDGIRAGIFEPDGTDPEEVEAARVVYRPIGDARPIGHIVRGMLDKLVVGE
jgi:hypothetical protein